MLKQAKIETREVLEDKKTKEILILFHSGSGGTRTVSEVFREKVEGWFAAAKSAGLYEEAVKLANKTPCDPRTLTRAARDNEEKKPRFAVEAGMAALR